MTKRILYNRIKALLLAICLLINCSIIVYSVSGTTYESEINNISSKADLTYEDYNNYGALTSEIDSADWWKLKFDEDGLANIWLGNIPSGCNYYIQVFTDPGAGNSIATSNKTSNQQELIRMRVEADTYYYIKVASTSGHSGSNYLLRAKNYPVEGTARIFTTYYIYNNDDHSYSENSTEPDRVYSTRPIADSLDYIWDMGYAGGEYLNNVAAPIYNTMPDSIINVIACHGNKGYFTQGRSNAATTVIYANGYNNMSSANRALSTYSNNALSNNYLTVYTSCYSGATSDQGYGNVVDMTLEKGAMNCIGWIGKVNTANSNYLVARLFEYMAQGNSAKKALDLAILDFERTGVYDNGTLYEYYYGNCDLRSLVLG